MDVKALIGEFVRLPNRPSIGVALSGGAARGIAHVGVIQQFEEWGLPIDYIAGTSAGAIVGAAVASGITGKTMEKIARETEWWFLAKPIGFRSGLLSSRGFESWLARFIHAPEFADLTTPLAVTATDFCSGELVVIKDGPLLRAVRASCTIPGIFQPVEFLERQLVDGGLRQNLPVTTCKSLGADVVIGVDTHSDIFTGNEIPQTVVLSITHAAHILMHHHTEEQRRQADLLVQPRVGKMSAVNFRDVDMLINEGRTAALRSLPSLVQFLNEQVGKGN